MKLANQQFGIVKLGMTLIGIPIACLSEVFRAETEQRLPQKGELLRGGMELRGRLVPILEFDAFARTTTERENPQLGVVLEDNRKLLSFFVDDIVGFVTVAENEIHLIQNTGSSDAAIFKAVFAYRDGFVSILDVSLLFALPNVFTVDKPVTATKETVRSQKPVLTFEAGSAYYSVPAVEVYAAIPKQKIERTAIAIGACLGEITYHGRRIPVVCPARILGLGQTQRPSVTEVVALRFPDNLVLGFAVDAIQKIGAAPTGKETSVPIWRGKRNFVEKVIVNGDEPEVYAIDIGKLTAAEDLLEIASLSRPNASDVKAIERTASRKENIARERSRYLVVDATRRLAIPLAQINRIVHPPKRLTVAHADATGFKGYFSLSNESVALFDLSECMGQKSRNAEDSKVLLTGLPGHQMGFLVERVVGIEISEWSENPSSKHSNTATRLVQLGDTENAVILPAFDLKNAVVETSSNLGCE